MTEQEFVRDAEGAKLARMGMNTFRKLAEEFDCIETRRGVGLMQGLVFKVPVGAVINRALEKGLVLINAGTHILRFVPPLIITEEHVDAMTAILRECIKQAEAV